MKELSFLLVLSIGLVFSFRNNLEATSKDVPSKIEKLPVTYLFPPLSETEIAVSSDKDIWVGWKAKFDSDKYKMKNYAIQAKDRFGGSSVSTHFGSIKAKSSNGKIKVTMKNVEDFPIEVNIYIKNK